MLIPDSQTLHAAIEGDRAALAEVVGSAHRFAVLYCRARLGNHDSRYLAESIAAQVCHDVVASLLQNDEPGRPFLELLYAVTAHKVADAIERAGAAPNPDDRVTLLMNTLPSSHRETLVLRVVLTLTPQQTAVALGTSVGSVRLHGHRALVGLRRDVA